MLYSRHLSHFHLSIGVFHKYLFSLQNNYGAGKLNVMIANATYSSIGVGADNLYDTIWQAVGDVTQWAFIVNVRAGCATGTYYVRPISSDLDLWYGSPDRIPAHLLSHPEDWGRYYAGSLDYNAGTLESADGTVMRSIGRNVWDEEWESGSISSVNGANLTAASEIRSKNYIPVIPNAPYWFKAPANLKLRYYDAAKNYIGYVDKDGISGALNTARTMPSNCAFIRFATESTTYGNNITISLYYPGESGYDQYYPYSVLAEVDTGSEVLYAYDEKLPDGTIYRNTLRIDLGTLSYTALSNGNNVFFANVTGVPNDTGNGNMPKLKCAKYVTTTAKNATSWASATDDKVISLGYDSARIYFRDTAFSDASLIPAALSGVYIEVEAATPTTEQGTPFSGASADNFAIDDFGSMYWTQSAGVPQGVEIFYPYDYKAAVDTLLNTVDGDVEELVTETELGAVADRIPEAPAEDGTYTLKATVADGVKTYAWVADE